MIFGRDNRKVTNVSEWLEIATVGIAADGKERITREIKTHYCEAVEAHLKQGKSEQVAQTKALEELGDPWAAARRFRKKHLSGAEQKFLHALYNRAFAPVRNPSVIFCVILFPLMFYYTSQVEEYSARRVILFASTLIMTCVLFPLLAYFQAKRLSVAMATRRLLMIDVSTWAALGLVVTLVTWSYEGPFGIFVLCSILTIRRRLVVLNKILKPSDAENLTPTAP
jgi:hypothetical protein